MEEKRLPIPDGYEFDKVENGEVILKKKKAVLPQTLEEILPMLGETDYASISMPKGMCDSIRALCDLIFARNAWWKQLGWKPDWTNEKEPFKWCIHAEKGSVMITSHSKFPRILAFPTYEIAAEFRDAFKDLIEEAKELL